jgi:hypothetical protein
MRVSIEDHGAQQETRTFRDIETQAIRRFDRIMDVHLRVAMFAVKNFKEEGEIVGTRGAQSKIFDRGDLLFESGPQFLFVERLLTAKFDDAGALCAFFLFFYDCSPRSLLVFWSSDINGALRCDFKCEGQASKREKEPGSHLSENELDI